MSAACAGGVTRSAKSSSVCGSAVQTVPLARAQIQTSVRSWDSAASCSATDTELSSRAKPTPAAAHTASCTAPNASRASVPSWSCCGASSAPARGASAAARQTCTAKKKMASSTTTSPGTSLSSASCGASRTWPARRERRPGLASPGMGAVATRPRPKMAPRVESRATGDSGFRSKVSSRPWTVRPQRPKSTLAVEAGSFSRPRTCSV
mmetsp:Transcript_49562/g.158581  ORF Transcript_49562/g.158581 Transcript_49562/m.158581 type:complete len:208 (+) Transcript_49562:23-646(+)